MANSGLLSHIHGDALPLRDNTSHHQKGNGKGAVYAPCVPHSHALWGAFVYGGEWSFLFILSINIGAPTRTLLQNQNSQIALTKFSA
jgi:hypothetical protein